jgi:hypothetical protein
MASAKGGCVVCMRILEGRREGEEDKIKRGKVPQAVKDKAEGKKTV